MKKDNFDVHKWNNMQKMASIINEANMLTTKYLYQDFEIEHYGDSLYKELFKVLFDKNKKYEGVWLDPEVEKDWNKIINMEEKELQDTYGLTPEIAKKVKMEFDKNLNK